MSDEKGNKKKNLGALDDLMHSRTPTYRLIANSRMYKKYKIYIPVIILSIIFIYPLWILIIYAFQPAYLTFEKIYPGQVPLAFTLSNLFESFKKVDLIGPLTRSLEVAFMVGLIAIGLGIPAGYGLSKLTSSLSNKLIVFLFIINMMPGLVIAIPISVYFLHANLDNTVFGVAFAQELVVLYRWYQFLIGYISNSSCTINGVIRLSINSL